MKIVFGALQKISISKQKMDEFISSGTKVLRKEFQHARDQYTTGNEYDIPWYNLGLYKDRGAYYVATLEKDDGYYGRKVVSPQPWEVEIQYGIETSLRPDRSRWMELSDGTFLCRDYGKYAPGLSILCQSPAEYVGVKKAPSDYNCIGDGQLTVVMGEYFVSKKGTKCFKISDSGPHDLISQDWDRYTVLFLEQVPVEERVWYVSRMSNGSGVGTDYVIVKDGWRRILTPYDV